MRRAEHELSLLRTSIDSHRAVLRIELALAGTRLHPTTVFLALLGMDERVADMVLPALRLLVTDLRRRRSTGGSPNPEGEQEAPPETPA